MEFIYHITDLLVKLKIGKLIECMGGKNQKKLAHFTLRDLHVVLASVYIESKFEHRLK